MTKKKKFNMKKYQKEYRQRPEIKARMKEYCQEHADEIKARMKEYYQRLKTFRNLPLSERRRKILDRYKNI